MIKPIHAQLSTLLVDDNSTNLKILERTLKHHFSHLIDLDSIKKASNGYEALAARASHTCDLILLDIDMPGMSGVEVAQSVRQTDTDIIIIACTTSDSPEARVRYAEAGMDGCVSKPLDLREVNNVLIHALRSRKALDLYQEMGSPEHLDRYLVHRGSLPVAPTANTRKNLLAARSVSSSQVETMTPGFIKHSSTPEESLSVILMSSEDEHENCDSLAEDSEGSSDDSLVIRSRSGSMSFAKCACAGRRHTRRPRLIHAVSEDSISSVDSARERPLAGLTGNISSTIRYEAFIMSRQ